MSYELFMSAVVGDADAAKARALLGGFTEMRERHRVTRIQHYEPHDIAIKGLPVIKQLQKERRPAALQWQELHQILVKQPFILHTRTDITDKAQKPPPTNSAAGGEAASNAPAGSGSAQPSALWWTDLPDPQNQQLSFITQRRVLEIADPDAQSILAANKFRPTSNIIEESYSWWLDGVEYTLNRMFQPASLDPAPSVPHLASLEPFAPFWVLLVRAKVDSLPAATMPARMKQGQAHLVQARDRLLGVFDFRAFDRRCHDTRIQEARTA
ncbi:hypothetical protein N658DRAFT_424939 [Parathielavia hyrcaniae]|uniref:Mediator of RNA polymerase II transcription subunit 18 n=1 Tax=Parathielavia hyrcaniae TaxID=113614 RepID=A0AAN6Q4V0_9PEZI|nr:hypothetical protein N658DRAFT_424939 [Parathielavia hyrcaniae]